MAILRSPNFPAPAPQWLSRPSLRLAGPDDQETLTPEVLEAACEGEEPEDDEPESERCPECGCFLETDLHEYDCSYGDSERYPERPHDTALIGSKR
jgi:hypothetical protein